MNRALPAWLALAALAAACSPYRAEYSEGMVSFDAGNYRAAAAKWDGLKQYTKDLNYPIYLLDLAYASEFAGDAQEATAYYRAGIAAMSQELEPGVAAAQVATPGEGKYYRGDQFEHVFAHVFFGRAFFRLGQWDDARIEFQKANELDISGDADKEHDVGVAHFMLGESFLKLEDFNDASVAFRNAAKCAPENPYPHLELSRILRRYGDFNEARKEYAEYRRLDKNPERVSDSEDDDRGWLVALVDVGDGPYRIGDIANTKLPAQYPETGAAIRLDNDGRLFRGYRIDEVLPHAKHEAGKGVHAAKEAGLRIARKTLEIIAAEKTGVMIDVPENDYRRFDLMPGEFHLVVIPLAPGTYSGAVQLLGRNGGPFGGHAFDQVKIKAGEKTFLFLRAWTGPHPPRMADGRGPRM